MREADLTEWLNSPETKILQAYLRRRQAETVRLFLLNNPVDPQTQARAAAFHELEKLLGSPADVVQQTFEQALREPKTK